MKSIRKYFYKIAHPWCVTKTEAKKRKFCDENFHWHN